MMVDNFPPAAHNDIIRTLQARNSLRVANPVQDMSVGVSLCLQMNCSVFSSAETHAEGLAKVDVKATVALLMNVIYAAMSNAHPFSIDAYKQLKVARIAVVTFDVAASNVVLLLILAFGVTHDFQPASVDDDAARIGCHGSSSQSWKMKKK